MRSIDLTRAHKQRKYAEDADTPWITLALMVCVRLGVPDPNTLITEFNF
jgi:hypothetical protein